MCVAQVAINEHLQKVPNNEPIWLTDTEVLGAIQCLGSMRGQTRHPTAYVSGPMPLNLFRDFFVRYMNGVHFLLFWLSN